MNNRGEGVAWAVKSLILEKAREYHRNSWKCLKKRAEGRVNDGAMVSPVDKGGRTGNPAANLAAVAAGVQFGRF